MRGFGPGVLTTALVLALTGTACGAHHAAGGPALTLYSGQHAQTVQALVDKFTAQTGQAVHVRTDDEGILANQILQEGSRSPADLYFAENSPPLEALQAKGLLAPVDPPTLAAVSSTDDSPQGDWVGVSARAGALVYNTARLTPGQLPGSVLDLANPAWKGKVGLAPSETDFQPIVAAVVKVDGQAAATSWLDGLKANATRYEDNESLVAAVNRGDVQVGIVNTYYWYRLRDEQGASAMHSALAFFKPGDPGNLVDISGAAVLASSTHQAAAQRFLAFLVSAPAQEIIATSESYEYPIAAGVTTTKVATPLSGLAPPPLSVADLGDGSGALALLQQVGLL
ncbi:MAG TPA: extracellular solute-binding protein [Actinomycetota bacterium]|nr:extracellular solute-binding protein [Actinomycetota bacterium]